MYLKQIDLFGFKSFTDKTKISFEEGISCIVGPNGSGKSNISDALRWVLGEQSARSLRGSKLEDVIFSGSKNRKPLGMAEVTITLDNSDGYLSQPFSEIAVTRRTFRSGQSEYLINQKSCRLKDIYQLFVDTGIGLEGVSLISQGKINEIISAHPEDRRVLVEDAAGIIKYRNRKREAVRKLLETERHLERISDIIVELADRVGPLSEQSEKALQYQEMKQTADCLQIAISVQVLKETKDKLTQVEEEMSQNEHSLIETETGLHNNQAQMEQLRMLIDGLDAEVADLQKEYYQMQTQRERILAQMGVTQGNHQNKTENKERLAKELQQLEEQALIKQKELNDCQTNLAQEKDQVQAMEVEIMTGEGDAQKRRQAVTFLEEKLKKSKEDAFEIANELADRRNKSRYQDQLLSNHQQSVLRMDQQKEQIEESLLDLEKQLASLDAQMKENDGDLRHLSGELSAYEKTQKRINDERHQVAENETSCRYQHHALQTRVHMMQEMFQSYDGFFPGVRGVLLAKQKSVTEVSGVIDVFSQLIDVPSEFQNAIETYLGANLQNIVTQTEKSAKSAIAYLKNNQLGRATFLPLDTLTLRPRLDLSAVKNQKGSYGRASELVICEDQVRPAVNFLLDHLLVVEDMNTATVSAKTLGYRCSIVTLDGDMVNPGGTLTGGSKNKKNSDILSKKNLLEQAQKDLSQMDETLAEWENKLIAIRGQAADIAEQIRSCQEAIAKKQEANNALQKEKDTCAVAYKANRYQLDTIFEERRSIMAQQDDILSRQEELVEEIEARQKQSEDLEETVRSLEQTWQHKQEQMETEREDITSVKLDLAAKQQVIIELEKTAVRLQQELDSLNWEEEEKAADLDLLLKEIQGMQAAIDTDKEALLRLEEKRAQQEALLNSKRHGFAVEMNHVNDLEKQEKELSKLMIQLRDLVHQHELKKTRWESDWENEERVLKENFDLDYTQAVKMELPDLSRREMVIRLNELKRQIEELGVVNLAAIEEYRQVKERYDFLTAQISDLRSAKLSLEQVITEMDEKMSQRFRKAFLRLNDEFGKAIHRLFGGGTASFVMTDPDNLLETGIDIVVQLPGKKLSNYNLLSGGEKTLIGIAILFATLAVRPAPFCVMDEVDASLDEANIDRFAAYLHDLSSKTQFILISHRQGTMEVAQSLWGITMEEEGVSKVISVRLQDVEHKVS